MSVGNPSAYLLWALLAVSFFTFMLIHLWSYDKFKCLRWNSGRQPGAFKRVMTYSYFATVPLLMVFSVGFAALKYQEGSAAFPDGTIMPRPFSEWQKIHLQWIIPLYFILSIAWSLELVTHLEELTFWLFLLHQGPRKREWFHSWEFRTWYIGSIMAILGMPLTTLMKRHNVETCGAWIFLAGSSAGTTTTVCFLYVLANFPAFIRSVKAEGAEPDVVVRLATFYHLNCIRVVFRFIFTVPLLILGVDGLVDKSYLVVSSNFWSDILLMMGAMGCFISSAITMLIFFPRSMTSESGYKAHTLSQNSKAAAAAAASTELPHYERHHTPHPSSPKSMTSIHRAQIHAFQFPNQQQPEMQESPDDLELYIPADADQENDYAKTHHQQPYSPRPPSGTRSDDTVWEGGFARKATATASTSQLSRQETFRPPLFINGTPIYVEEVPPSPPYPHIHPYVSFLIYPPVLSLLAVH
ncbi:hypothetical protein C8F04DRAFT_625119 [Mycena alexandri]|uniref:Transmembrane protein n=1 Tax=Mycena alexandri TaxID=1745969 RepID=A0AAD6SX85_9AGAR|nr:hypothetical protein C8F04DRAFT_625119 [Mycena alexandri]